MKNGIILTAIAAIGVTMASCGEPDRADPVAHDRNDAPRVTPEAIEASLAAAEEYFHTRDLAKAEAILLRLIDRAPNEGRALELYAHVLMSQAGEARDQGDERKATELFSEAYERYRAVVEMSPDSAGLQQSAGEVAQVAGRDDDALRHYQRARQLNPNDPKPHFFAAQVHIQRGEHGEAEAALEQVLRVDPDEPLAHASLANIASEQGRFDDAMKHISEARSIRPRDVSLRVIEASIHRRRGEPERALQLLVGLDAEQRSRWFVTEELAAASVAVGEHRRAGEAWAHFHRSNPEDGRAWLAAVHAGDALLKAGDRREARIWLQQARVMAPDAPETLALARAFGGED